MDRNMHVKWIPLDRGRIAPCDQYMFPEMDKTERLAENGVSQPIYACNGTLSYTLPLHMYPKVNQVHPQISRSQIPHFPIRDPHMLRLVNNMQTRNLRDIREGRLEGFYHYE
jgi:hypothetical protein